MANASIGNRFWVTILLLLSVVRAVPLTARTGRRLQQSEADEVSDVNSWVLEACSLHTPFFDWCKFALFSFPFTRQQSLLLIANKGESDQTLVIVTLPFVKKRMSFLPPYLFH